MSDRDTGAISLAEASRLSGISTSTLKRWAEEGIVPVAGGQWTRASAAQARVIARMRERGYSLDAVREAARGGRLAFGYAEDLFQVPAGEYTKEQAAAETGLEAELIERLMTLLGTPIGMEGRLNEEDLRAMRHCAEVLSSGFPLVAFLQLVRVYAQAIRKVADAEVRLFHLYVHEPLMQDGVPPSGDGRGDGGPRLGPAAGHRPADGVHAQPLPALLHRAGRRRPHGGRRRQRRARARPRLDGVLLRRPHRVHPLHGGGGRRGGARPGRALRRHG